MQLEKFYNEEAEKYLLCVKRQVSGDCGILFPVDKGLLLEPYVFTIGMSR